MKAIAPWLIAAAIYAAALGQASLAQSVSIGPSNESLVRFLRTYDTEKTTRYVAAFPDLNGDGKPEALVYLVSSDWCGSGGCTLLILAQSGASWRIVTKVPIVQLPCAYCRRHRTAGAT